MTLDPTNGAASPIARILISGDQPLMRAALRQLIDAEPDMSIIGECENEPSAVAREAKARPDLVIMDIDFQSICCGAQERLGDLFGAAGQAPILIVTDRKSVKCLQCSLQCGASGLVMKDRPAEVLMRAIRAVLSGEIWLERLMVAEVFRGEPKPKDDVPAPEKLTPREQEIVDLVRLGLPNKRIAERLFISAATVRHHLTSIFGKMGVTSRCELMSFVFLGRHNGDEAVVAESRQ